MKRKPYTRELLSAAKKYSVEGAEDKFIQESIDKTRDEVVKLGKVYQIYSGIIEKLDENIEKEEDNND